MEGAIGERLKREFNITLDPTLAMASLVYQTESRQALRHIYEEYVGIAERYGLPFLATTPTRRANRERVGRSQYDETLFEENVRFLKELRETSTVRMYVGGLMGCKGDAYKATGALSVAESWAFHAWQAGLFKAAGAEFLFAGIMPVLSEAIGMAMAMEETGLPYIISFMIQRNGLLLDGTTIHKAIREIDAATNRKPVCYMANCVHPRILLEAVRCEQNDTPLVKTRFRGIQANTSPLSPEELDNRSELLSSDATVLADDMIQLANHVDLKIVGGCCGTDGSHLEQIAKRFSDRLE
jgi:S-methylmethionine-dependent homocysteine/selenocysteine methylase